MKVTNSHHFCEGVELFIDGDNHQWKVDKISQKLKYGTCPLGKQSDETDGILNPQNNVTDFIKLLNLAFEFTGCLTNRGKIYNQLEISKEGVTTKDVVELIYNKKLEHKVGFVCLSQCGCNMGHCDVITGVHYCSDEMKTYGDVMSLFGYPVVVDGFTYFEYPDSVLLSLEKVDGSIVTSQVYERFTHKPTSIRCECGECENPTFDPDTIYLSYEYGR